MSDQQPSPPPAKPKPGSLRDRIAAFEKSATAPASTGAPAPRPKPSGFASWKPKAPSPPSSPSSKSIEHAASSSLKASGAMSASDAKESITKGGGGSLKDRMAALQGKGAFGAPAPPLAPKPAAEKPRWKPPPAVAAPVDVDDHDGVGNTTGDEPPAAAIAAAVDRTKSPPVSVKPRESLDLPKPIAEGEETSVAEPITSAEGDAEGITDAEEEERQRRATIAARMARLGGARMGMAPPVLAKKPPIPVRKPTREDIPKQEAREEVPKRQSISFEDKGKNMEENISFSPPKADEGATVASPPSLTDIPHVESQSDIEPSPEHLPAREHSENASLLSVDSTDSNAPRSPSSMPVPTVPRRAGPPRKKPMKPTAPPPDVPEVHEERVEEAIATSAVIPIVDEPEPKAVETEAIKVPEHKDLDYKEIDDHQDEIHDESRPMDLDVHQESAEDLVAEREPASHGEAKEQEFAHDVQSPLAAVEAPNESKQQHGYEHEPEYIVYPDQPEDQPEDDGSHYEHYESHYDPDENHYEHDIIDYSDEHSQDYDENHAAEHHEQHQQQDDDHHVNIDAEPSSSLVEEEDEDAAEEEARRKRVAERLAKMGGINPFAAPPLRRSSQDIGQSSPVSSHPSSPSVALPASPPRQDLPFRRPSLRSYEVAEPHSPPVVESKVEEEEQGEAEYSDEVEDEDNYVSGEEGSSEEIPIEDSSLSAFDHPPPLPPQLHQQVDAAPLRQLPDPVLRPPVPNSARPQVQVQQHGRDDEEEVRSATRYISPPSRFSGSIVSHEDVPSVPARPAQPHRRIVPQAPEEKEQEEQEEEEEEEAGTDDEGHEIFVPSHLLMRSPVQPRDPVSQYPVMGGQHYEVDEDGDGSENDAPALPVLQRRLEEVPAGRSFAPPPPPLPALRRRSVEVPSGRSLAPPPPPPAPPSNLYRHHHLPVSPSDISEPDSDHDGQALPVRPRHTAVPPAPPTSGQVPFITPRRSVPPVPENEESFSSSYGMPLVAVSEPESAEVLDEEEGDPIDPSFHSPSRRSSMGNLRTPEHGDTLGLPVLVPSSSAPVLTTNVEKREDVQQEQEQGPTRRQTIAERMAKLGGLKFGAAPVPGAISRPPPASAPQEEELDEEGGAQHHPQAVAEDVEQPVQFSEEEEERARKERIAAKLAGMGGMRIGMMPIGMGPQRAQVLRDENVAPPSPTRAVPPPIRPPPPPVRPQTQDTGSERVSDDGVKVEAEESEMEEVNYEDAAEELEPPPPLVPSRGGRVPYRRESSDKANFSPRPPSLIPGSRPPVPAALPRRRSSAQTSKSIGSVEFGLSPSRSSLSHGQPQSEYVMVDEPQSSEEAAPPSPRTSWAPPVRPRPNPMMIPRTSDPNRISSQWELPSIPTAALDFRNSTDLSLSSWTDAGEPTSPPLPSPPLPSPPPPLPSKQPAFFPPKPKAVLASELQLSTDDLMMMWGRVGVQVCEVATSLFEKSKKTLIGDGTYAGFINAVLAQVPNAAPISIASGEYGYLVYAQNGSSVQKRVSEIMPGDIVEIHEGKLKGHKGIQTYHQNVGGSGEALLGVVGEFEAKKSKIRVFHANQHVGQQTVESVSYRLEDLRSGTVKVYRVLELRG